ncbi:hypothetical protein [Pleionea sp. CnH1-48]|uniref:hypothetical protein n=1 Tax=Pleionea sp. CnH1-48 TaxID=2954494 RepID=UPI00209762E1|nr:hypothetical protein [Pleionea sp. CnH1-48]MCO7223929.1 hypothetical protein [Pleionea sp. CnH1-48]
MKNTLALIVAAFILSLLSSHATAGTCEIKYTRTACDGKEKISYKKCKGKQSCSKFKEAADAAQCKKLATKSCANKRYSITKSKVINAVFDGTALTTDSGSDDFCTIYENKATEFNQCPEDKK